MKIDLTIDPEFKALIPPPTSDELKGLEEDIKANGVISPLVVWKETGILLDGHNRHEICGRLGKEFKTTELSFANRQQAAEWIIKHQLGRRNLSESQRALMAGKLANLKRGGDRKSEEIKGTSGPLISRDKAASMLNVSTKSVARAKKVLKEGSPELVAAVDRGEVSVTKAAQVVSLPKSEQLPAAKSNSPKIEIKTEKKEEPAKKEPNKRAIAEFTLNTILHQLENFNTRDPYKDWLYDEIVGWIEAHR